jgi:methionyl-tRNA formyltransferase
MDSISNFSTPNDFRDRYPGFPTFIHHIMSYIDNGDTAEQAAEKVQNMMNAGILKTTIEEIEATRLTLEQTRIDDEVIVEIDESGSAIDQ